MINIFMKNILLSLILSASLILVPGCAFFENVSKPGQTVRDYIPYIEPSVAIAASAVFVLAINEKDRVSKALVIYTVADVVQALASGVAPTPEQFESVLGDAVPDKEHWASFAVSIASVYSSVYYRVSGDAKVSLEALVAIAGGLKKAVRPYLPAAPVTVVVSDSN